MSVRIDSLAPSLRLQRMQKPRLLIVPHHPGKDGRRNEQRRSVPCSDKEFTPQSDPTDLVSVGEADQRLVGGPAARVLPLPPNDVRSAEPGRLWERVGVRATGPRPWDKFENLSEQASERIAPKSGSPLIRPIGHLLPHGGEGPDGSQRARRRRSSAALSGSAARVPPLPPTDVRSAEPG